MKAFLRFGFGGFGNCLVGGNCSLFGGFNFFFTVKLEFQTFLIVDLDCLYTGKLITLILFHFLCLL